MKYPMRSMFGAGLISVIASVLMIGCEITPEGKQVLGKQVAITPSIATILKGGTLTLVATGGNDYFWILSDDSMGSLNSQQGDTVIYTSQFTPAKGENALQKVTVVSTGGGASTNAIPSTLTAVAYITHLR